jgi:hypothetical protein
LVVARSAARGHLPTGSAVGGLYPAGSTLWKEERRGTVASRLWEKREETKRGREREMGNYLDTVTPPRVTSTPLRRPAMRPPGCTPLLMERRGRGRSY